MKPFSSCIKWTAPSRRRRMGAGLGLVALWMTGGTIVRAQSPAEPPPPKAPAAPAAAPALNWVLPLFTDKEGWRTMTLRGSEVRPGPNGIAVIDLSITIFSGKEDAKVDSILLSPDAQFLPKERRALGSKTVRFIRDDIEVTGVGWIYEHDAKKISIARNVRVVFHTQLNDILK